MPVGSNSDFESPKPLINKNPERGTVLSRPLNSTAASLLGFLHERPMAGWDLLATAQMRIGDFWTVSQSQVYRELASMAKAGLIEAGVTGPRERKPYQITADGRAAFEEWIDQEPALESIRYPLLLTVAFAQHLQPERLASFLTSHRAEHARRLAVYEQQESSAAEAPAGVVDDLTMATLNFGLAYERAVLAWIDTLPSDLSGDR